MDSIALLETLIVQAPNFIFAGLGLALAYVVIRRVLDMLEGQLEDCSEKQRMNEMRIDAIEQAVTHMRRVQREHHEPPHTD
jgi:hypothetical protein